jgi:hypothetical protein
VYEHEVRTQLAREHVAQLRLDMSLEAARRRPLLRRIPFRFGRRFALEPRTECREVSSRA